MDVKRKKCKVIMLPVNNRADKGEFIIVKHEDNSLHCGIKKQNPFNMLSEEQNLYITSDDEIKEGDWFIELEHIVAPDSEFEMIKESGIYQRKISSQSPELFLKEGYINGVKDSYINNSLLTYCKKIIATTDKSLKVLTPYSKEEGIKEILPSPSKAFIEKYCKLGGIDEVMVEYEDNGYEVDMEGRGGSDICWYPDWQLKINSHNEITIHPVKDSWTREEVEELCRKALFAKGSWYEEEVDEWIEENL